MLYVGEKCLYKKTSNNNNNNKKQLNVSDNKVSIGILKDNFCVSEIPVFLPSETERSQLWGVEWYGTLSKQHLLSLTSEEHFLNILKTTKSFDICHFEVGSFWWGEYTQLPFSWDLALKVSQWFRRKIYKQSWILKKCINSK